MPTRAKLYVASVTREASAIDAVKVTLAAVTRGEDNKTWAEATPVARFEMTIQNPSAAVQFTLGQEFYVDFTPVGSPATLADGHDYEPSDYEREHPNHGYNRCQRCGAKAPSHEEPLRSQFRDWRP